MKIYGKNAVTEALRSAQAVSVVTISDGLNKDFASLVLSLCKKRNISLKTISRAEFKKIEGEENYQGIFAEVEDYNYFDLETLLEQKNIFLLLLDGIEDPHNFGAIIRVAECAGVTGIIIPKNRSVSINATVAKVSAGALFHVKIAQVTNIHDAIDKIKNSNTFVYAADMDGETMYNTNLDGNIAIVVGSEGKGVSSLTRKKVDGIVSIPMFGQVNSLNASVSAGIVLYEVVRQRMKNE